MATILKEMRICFIEASTKILQELSAILSEDQVILDTNESWQTKTQKK